MPKTYFENDIYKSLSNQELLKKQEEIQIKLRKQNQDFFQVI